LGLALPFPSSWLFHCVLNLVTIPLLDGCLCRPQSLKKIKILKNTASKIKISTPNQIGVDTGNMNGSAMQAGQFTAPRG
jgi:hypothetical protein